METTFSSDSPVGRLYGELIQKAPARGVSRQALEKRIDRGYTEDVFYLPARFTDPGKISAGEVLEYAYQFKTFYPLLHKHGFLVPFAMDDFDPSTDDDHRLRERIAGTIRSFRKELSEGVKAGSDEYKMALARKLYGWLLPQLQTFRSDPIKQRTALEAWRLKEGECTEQSAIAYYIFREAGLKPVFLFVRSLPPTLANYFGKTKDTLKTGHVFIGIPLPEAGRWVHIDFALERFDAVYPGAVLQTARHYVYGSHLSNQLTAESEGNGSATGTWGELVRQCRSVAPQSFYCWEKGLTALANRPDGSEARAAFNRARPLLQHYPEASRQTEWFLKISEALRQNNLYVYLANIKAWLGDLRRTATGSPHYVSSTAMGIYQNNEGIRAGLEQSTVGLKGPPIVASLARLSLEALLLAVETDPNWMAPYGDIAEMNRRSSNLAPEIFAFLHRIGKKNPDHIYIHYLAAEVGHGLLRDSPLEVSEEEAGMILHHVKRLENLEPDHPVTLWFGMEARVYRREMEAALAHFEAIRAKLGVRKTPDRVYAVAALIFLVQGKEERALKLLREVYDSDPKEGPLALMEILLKGLWPRPPTVEEEGTDSSETRGNMELNNERMWEVFNLLHTVVGWLAEAEATREKSDILWSRLLFAALMFQETAKTARKAAAALGGSLSKEGRQIFLEEFDRFAKGFEKVKSVKKDTIIRAENFFARVEGWAGQEGHERLARAHVELARLALRKGEYAVARRIFRKAHDLSPDILRQEIYGNRLIQEFFTPWLDNKDDLPLRRRCWEVLEWGYRHRERFSKETLDIFRTGYKLLRDHHQAGGEKKEAALASRRLEGL